MPPRGGQLRVASTTAGGFLVSIHAPTRGATPASRRTRGRSARFNTCPHAGGNTRARWTMFSILVSIHAPTRGATGRHDRLASEARFQYMPPRGGQHDKRLMNEQRKQFQYMPPRGGQQYRPNRRYGRAGFNTCPHAGGNGSDKAAPSVEKVSIHAPTRGATLVWDHWQNFCGVSIHAPTRGATLSTDININNLRVSIHAPTRGATWVPSRTEPSQKVSIHAPTRGATRWTGNCKHQPMSFNTCPHAGGNTRST